MSKVKPENTKKAVDVPITEVYIEKIEGGERIGFNKGVFLSDDELDQLHQLMQSKTTEREDFLLKLIGRFYNDAIPVRTVRKTAAGKTEGSPTIALARSRGEDPMNEKTRGSSAKPKLSAKVDPIFKKKKSGTRTGRIHGGVKPR